MRIMNTRLTTAIVVAAIAVLVVIAVNLQRPPTAVQPPKAVDPAHGLFKLMDLYNIPNYGLTAARVGHLVDMLYPSCYWKLWDIVSRVTGIPVFACRDGPTPPNALPAATATG